jgi:hypothetical protein
MSEFKQYRRKSVSEMRDYEEGEMLNSKVSISDADLKAGSPKLGDMIARNPKNHEDQWLVAKAYFEDNLEEIIKTGKSLGNTDSNGAKKNVRDIVFWGNGDNFKLIGKASSKDEGWMKSTKAMEIEGVGCVVQITTQQHDQVAEAVTFVPLVKIQETKENNKVIARRLVSI